MLHVFLAAVIGLVQGCGTSQKCSAIQVEPIGTINGTNSEPISFSLQVVTDCNALNSDRSAYNYPSLSCDFKETIILKDFSSNYAPIYSLELTGTSLNQISLS